MSLVFRQFNEEVLYANEEIIKVDAEQICELKARCMETKRGRVRLCTHGSPEDGIHEMLIVIANKNYIRPHKHPGKVESFHIIEGELDVIIFNDSGEIVEVVRMGTHNSGRKFYYRLPDSHFHTVLIRSELAVFHETTNGPFIPGETVFADWSPEENDVDAVVTFRNGLDKRIHEFDVA